jgi:hypothetical protein
MLLLATGLLAAQALPACGLPAACSMAAPAGDIAGRCPGEAPAPEIGCPGAAVEAAAMSCCDDGSVPEASPAPAPPASGGLLAPVPAAWAQASPALVIRPASTAPLRAVPEGGLYTRTHSLLL